MPTSHHPKGQASLLSSFGGLTAALMWPMGVCAATLAKTIPDDLALSWITLSISFLICVRSAKLNSRSCSFVIMLRLLAFKLIGSVRPATCNGAHAIGPTWRARARAARVAGAGRPAAIDDRLINGSALTEAAGTLNWTLKIALQTHIVDGPNVSDLEGPLEIQFMA